MVPVRTKAWSTLRLRAIGHGPHWGTVRQIPSLLPRAAREIESAHARSPARSCSRLPERGVDLHTVQLFLDHANISTSSRYLKPSKLALHTVIQRIDTERGASGEATKWEQELAEMRQNLQAVPQKCHKLVESTAEQGSKRTATARRINPLGA